MDWKSRRTIFAAAGFPFTTCKEAADAFADEKLKTHFYHRYGHDNPDIFAMSVAKLDRAEDGIATSSGEAAIELVCKVFVQPGEAVVSSARIYGGTYNYFTNYLLAERGVQARFVPDPTDLVVWERAMRPRFSFNRWQPKVAFLESPGNPLLEVYDIAAIANVVHKNGALLVVDNTIAGPTIQRPLEFGADLVVYSATKYLTNGLFLSGVVTGGKELIEPLRQRLGVSGVNLGVFESWFATTAVAHLEVRMKQHSQNASALARFLYTHPAVKRVYYPGLNSTAQRELVRKQMGSKGSGLLSFEIEGGKDASWCVCDHLVANGTAIIVPHLGETETMAIHPATTTHAKLTQAQRQEAGIGDGLIRVSVGLEEKEKILSGFNDALSTIAPRYCGAL